MAWSNPPKNSIICSYLNYAVPKFTFLYIKTRLASIVLLLRLSFSTKNIVSIAAIFRERSTSWTITIFLALCVRQQVIVEKS